MYQLNKLYFFSEIVFENIFVEMFFRMSLSKMSFQTPQIPHTTL